jgi:hypothetical protein
VTIFSSLTSKLVTTVSPGLTSKPVVDFLVELQNQCGGGFSGLGLKIGRFGLVIWASKSPRQFLGFGLKIKWDSVYRLRHKIDEGRSAWDTRRDLAEARRRVVHVAQSRRLRQRQFKDGRVDTTDCVRPFYHTFTVFNVLCSRSIVIN